MKKICKKKNIIITKFMNKSFRMRVMSVLLALLLLSSIMVIYIKNYYGIPIAIMLSIFGILFEYDENDEESTLSIGMWIGAIFSAYVLIILLKIK